MGNRSSKISSNNATQNQKTEDVNDSETSVSSSGVFLTQELQNELVSTFESKILQTEWNKLQSNIITSHNQRLTQHQERRLNLAKELNQWRQHNQQVQSSLDSKIEDLRAKFSDEEASIRFDVGKLEKKLQNVPKFGSTNNACIQLRMEVASCLKDSKDSRSCNGFVEALERCTKQTVVSS